MSHERFRSTFGEGSLKALKTLEKTVSHFGEESEERKQSTNITCRRQYNLYRKREPKANNIHHYFTF